MVTNISLQNLSSVALESFSASEYFALIRPLIFYIIGITLYSIFIWKFYRFLAKRDILKLQVFGNGRGLAGYIQYEFSFLVYIIENLILVPILVFFWFSVLALLLLFLVENQNPQSLIMIAIAVVASVRITSYFSEDLSKDLAKLVPFALLGVFITDVSFFSMEHGLSVITSIPDYFKDMMYYMIFVVILEYGMRLIKGTLGLFIPRKEEPSIS